jgi:hypothetical protein
MWRNPALVACSIASRVTSGLVVPDPHVDGSCDRTASRLLHLTADLAARSGRCVFEEPPDRSLRQIRQRHALTGAGECDSPGRPVASLQAREGSGVRARAPSGNRAISTATRLPPMIPLPGAGPLWATAITSKERHAERDTDPGVTGSDLDAGIDCTRGSLADPRQSRREEMLAGLDALFERLAAQRIEHEPIQIYSNGVRHVNVPDPDGNAIAFAEPPTPRARDVDRP